MGSTTAAQAPTPRRRLARGLRFAAGALAAHGLLLLVLGGLKDFLPSAPDGVAVVAFWLLAVPALLLAQPLTGLLWKLGLMNAPGWFAWPKPLGIALAYAIWIAALLGLAWAARAWPGGSKPEGRPP